MKNRTYICRHCGEIKRLRDEGRNAISSQKHCGIFMEPLSYEQAYAAAHLEKDSRLLWYEKGAHILRGRSKRKRWTAAINDGDIENSKRQIEAHEPKMPIDTIDQVLKTYYELAKPYIIRNAELLQFLQNKNATRYIEHILFISVGNFRADIYQHIKNYNLCNKPKEYLRKFVSFLISIVRYRDENIEKELMDLWEMKSLDNQLDLKIDGQKYFSASEFSANTFSLRNYAIKMGITIRQSAAPDGESAPPVPASDRRHSQP